MSLEDLKNALPDYAKDLKLNLSSLARETDLDDQKKWGTFLAVAYAVGEPQTVRAIRAEAEAKLDPAAASAAKAAAAQGAEIALTYQGDALKKRVGPLAAELGSELILPCDVTDTASMDALFSQIESSWGQLDFLVHAIAFSDKSELDGRYVDTSEKNFTQTMLVSCYSLTALAARAEKLMTAGGSILTLTYYGAEKVMPHYNVMGVAKAALEASVRYLAADLGKNGIRVNAISAGPVRTLAARGIPGFGTMAEKAAERTPLRRDITQDEVGDAALFLASPLSASVTGETMFVDAGFHAMGF